MYAVTSMTLRELLLMKLKNGLKDGFQTAGEGYGATYRGFHHLLRIDYLFHSTLLEGIKYKVIPYDMSDHNPVYLEVGL